MVLGTVHGRVNSGLTLWAAPWHTFGFIFNKRKSWKSGVVWPLFSLTSPGFSEIALLRSKQEVAAGCCANARALCGMSPIVTGTKTS